jgi:hypothetical protein
MISISVDPVDQDASLKQNRSPAAMLPSSAKAWIIHPEPHRFRDDHPAHQRKGTVSTGLTIAVGYQRYEDP